MQVIRTDVLTKRYPGVTALDGLTLALEPGITGLVGANGAGKSTLIKILLGLLPAEEGSAEVLGWDVRSHGRQIRAHVGYMPEHDCLPADTSAAELVVHLGRMSGLPLTSARERTADVLRHVGLEEARYRPIGGYSTGMRQRVKLAQALVHDPRLVLLDEPTNGLDPAARDEMLALIRRVGSDFGISVLVTSHLLGELERVSDHLVVLDAGKLLRSSSTAEFTNRTGVIAVEVSGRGDESSDGNARDTLGHALAAAGLRVWPAGAALEVQLDDQAAYDVIRDLVCTLGLGLVRVEERRHRIEEVFAGPSRGRHAQLSPTAAPRQTQEGAGVGPS